MSDKHWVTQVRFSTQAGTVPNHMVQDTMGVALIGQSPVCSPSLYARLLYAALTANPRMREINPDQFYDNLGSGKHDFNVGEVQMEIINPRGTTTVKVGQGRISQHHTGDVTLDDDAVTMWWPTQLSCDYSYSWLPSQYALKLREGLKVTYDSRIDPPIIDSRMTNLHEWFYKNLEWWFDHDASATGKNTRMFRRRHTAPIGDYTNQVYSIGQIPTSQLNLVMFWHWCLYYTQFKHLTHIFLPRVSFHDEQQLLEMSNLLADLGIQVFIW